MIIGLEKVSFHSNPKEGPSQRMLKLLNDYHIVLISHAGKLMLKILRAKLQQYINQEIPSVQVGFRKGKGTIYQIANICWIIKKENSRKKIYLCYINYAKVLTMWITTNCGKFLETGIQDHLT